MWCVCPWLRIPGINQIAQVNCNVSALEQVKDRCVSYVVNGNAGDTALEAHPEFKSVEVMGYIHTNHLNFEAKRRSQEDLGLV
jgi:hypothetical protein